MCGTPSLSPPLSLSLSLSLFNSLRASSVPARILLRGDEARGQMPTPRVKFLGEFKN
jgi:hypothetical protein